jgi:HME family heavy-metal exporter
VSPTVLTALLIVAALAPIAFSGIVGGTEVLRPLSIVILAGLISSTLFSLFVLPALYLNLFCRPVREPPRHAPDPAPAAV